MGLDVHQGVQQWLQTLAGKASWSLSASAVLTMALDLHQGVQQ